MEVDIHRLSNFFFSYKKKQNNKKTYVRIPMWKYV